MGPPGWPANAAARLRLNSPEATVMLAAHVLEGARDGRSAADLMKAGR
jgi:urease subunit gamma